MKKWLSLYAALVLLTACNQTKVLDDLNLVQVMGFDLAEGRKMKGMFVVALYRGEKKMQTRIFSSTGKTGKEIKAQADLKSALPLEIGQVRVIMFSKKFAQHGVKEIINTLDRIPRVGNLAFPAVTDGELENVLKTQYLEEEGVVGYLSSLIEQEIKMDKLPKSNLYLFSNSLYDNARDAYLPYISKEKDNLKVSGLALFREDKLKYILPAKSMFIFKALVEGFSNGVYGFHFRDQYAAIENIKAQTHYSLAKDTQPVLDVKVKVKGKMQELTKDKNLDNPKMVKQVEKAMKQAIQKEAEEMIHKFQKKGVDPLGIGKVYRAKTREWNEEKWRDMYQNLKVRVSAETNIVQSGVME